MKEKAAVLSSSAVWRSFATARPRMSFMFIADFQVNGRGLIASLYFPRAYTRERLTSVVV